MTAASEGECGPGSGGLTPRGRPRHPAFAEFTESPSMESLGSPSMGSQASPVHPWSSCRQQSLREVGMSLAAAVGEGMAGRTT